MIPQTDIQALEALSPNTQAVIYHALKSLSNDVDRQVGVMKMNRNLTAEMEIYYIKIAHHSQTLEMAFHTFSQCHTLANL